MKKIVQTLAAILIIVVTFNACKHEPPAVTIDPTPIPGPVVNNGVCFQNDILPLLQSNCAKSGCHDAATHEGDYVLDSYANIVKKGVVPGNAASSKIYKVLFKSGSDRMPPPPNADLTAAQKALIGQWINEGAKNTVNCGVSCDTLQFKYAANIAPMMSLYCTGCHSGAFPDGNIDLTTYTNVKAQANNGRLVGAITHSIGYSAMPKNASKLSECQIRQVQKWVNAGAPNN